MAINDETQGNRPMDGPETTPVTGRGGLPGGPGGTIPAQAASVMGEKGAVVHRREDEGDDERLPCGLLLSDVWDAADEGGGDVHLSQCPHCSAARAELGLLGEAVRDVLAAEADDAAEGAWDVGGLTERVMDVVRMELRPGRPLPLGGRHDLWMTETAVARTVRAAVDGLHGVYAGSCRIGPLPEWTGPAVPGPGSAAARSAGSGAAATRPGTGSQQGSVPGPDPEAGAESAPRAGSAPEQDCARASRSGPGAGCAQGPGSAPGVDSGPEPGCVRGPGSGPEPGCARGPGSGPEPGCALGPDSGPEPGCALGPDSGPEPGCARGPGSGLEPGCARGPDSGPEPGCVRGLGSAPGADPAPEPGCAREPGSGLERGCAQGPGSAPGAGSDLEGGYAREQGSVSEPGCVQGPDLAPGVGPAPGPGSAPEPGPAARPGAATEPRSASEQGSVPEPGSALGLDAATRRGSVLGSPSAPGAGREAETGSGPARGSGHRRGVAVVELEVAVSAPVPLREVADEVRERVRAAVDGELGLEVETIDIRITDIWTSEDDGVWTARPRSAGTVRGAVSGAGAEDAPARRRGGEGDG